jgi:PleD family two-component response regulator
MTFGNAAFEALLIGDGLSFHDLEAAKQHAAGERMGGADALVALSLVHEADGPGVERRVLGLGADDYVIKPFDAGVLLARVHAVFRRISAVAA